MRTNHSLGAPVAPRGRRALGWGLVLLGLAFNPAFAGFLASDGSIASAQVRAGILVVDVALVLLGVGVLRRWERPLMGRGFVIRVAVFTLVACSMVVLSELLVRLTMGPVERWSPPPTYAGELMSRPSRTFLADSLVGWRMRPGVEFRWKIDGEETSYRATLEGFRSIYSVADIPEDEALVTIVGDSFAFGTGVHADGTFSSLLDRALDGVTVHNLALPGMGIDQMWMVLRHHALPLRPRLVIVAFVDQDWDRSLTAYRTGEGMAKPTFVREREGLRRATASDAPPLVWRWLERHSALLGLRRAVARAIGYRVPLGSWWRINSGILEAMAEEARAAGATPLFVRLPLKNAPDFPTLEEHMRETGASYLDLHADAPLGIHFTGDDHINAAGHAYVAAALGRQIGSLLGP